MSAAIGGDAFRRQPQAVAHAASRRPSPPGRGRWPRALGRAYARAAVVRRAIATCVSSRSASVTGQKRCRRCRAAANRDSYSIVVLFQVEVIAVNQRFRDLCARGCGGPSRCRTRCGPRPAARLRARGCAPMSSRSKSPFDGRDAHGEDARGLALETAAAAPASRRRAPLAKPSLLAIHILDARRRVRGGASKRVQTHLARPVSDQSGQDVVAAAVGDDDLDALAGHARRNAALGRHAAPAPRRARRVDVPREVFGGSHAADHLRRRGRRASRRRCRRCCSG